MEHSIALVTGTTSGLGHAAARMLAAEGYREVIVTGRSLARVQETAAELADREPLAAPLFWFTTTGLIREKGIFSALWNCKADERQRSLLD